MTTDRIGSHTSNHRGTRLAVTWARDLSNYLKSLPWLNAESSLLDFGCGYFDVGIALAERMGRIDGYDIDEFSRRVARTRTAHLLTVRIHDASSDMPSGSYDLIFANSVFQYLGNDAGILATLRLFRTLLKPDGRGEVILADLIPRKYSSALDAFRSLAVSVRHGFPLTMVRFLAKAALHRSTLHQVDPDRLAELAREAGFDCVKLPTNLSPSRRRYTCVLKAR